MKSNPAFGANRMCPPEKMLLGRRIRAAYHPVELPAHRGNPYIEALPSRRTQAEVQAIMAGKVEGYDPSVRIKDPRTRRDYLETLTRAFVILPRHLRIEEAVMDSIRNSYGFRNPMTPGYMLNQVESVEKCDFESQDFDEAMVGASCVIGTAGTGKTRSIKRCLVRGCPQVIDHYDYAGKKLGIRQIAWIYVRCAHDGLVKSLCEDIARVIDAILGGSDCVRRVRAQAKEHDKQTEVARLLALHAVGLLVIDEFQNICVGRHIERQRLARFLVGAMESTSTRIMLVGTPEAEDEVIKDLPLTRRTIGENGQIEWGRITDSAEWIAFIKGIWKYQYTATHTPWDAEDGLLYKKLYEISYGIPDVAVRLYRMTQFELIGHPDDKTETIKSSMFEVVAKTRMKFAAKLLESMRINSKSTMVWDKPNTQKIVHAGDQQVEDDQVLDSTDEQDNTGTGFNLGGLVPGNS